VAIRTELGHAELDRVIVRGHDLTGELLGNHSFADMVALFLRGDLPTPDEARMLDALLMVLIEHGLVKPALVARMVYSNAPESMQGAVAAALLGAGSKHLGSSEHCARMVVESIATAGEHDAAAAIVESYGTTKAYIPGIGHRTHAEGDPRAIKLLEIARETGVYGLHCRLIEEVSSLASKRAGRLLPVNVTGAIAGIALDMGFRWQVCRAFALIGRTLGAIAQVQEEIDAPIADEVKDLVAAAARGAQSAGGESL
jgi:citrate synthase